MNVRDRELPDVRTVNLDSEDQPGALPVIDIGAAHVLGEGRHMLEGIGRQGRLPGAQPVAVGATHRIERAVFLPLDGADHELARQRVRRRTRAQKPTANGVAHPQGQHVDVTTPHAATP